MFWGPMLRFVIGYNLSYCLFAFCSCFSFFAGLLEFLFDSCNVQKRHRLHRDTMRENISNRLHAHVKDSPGQAVNFRRIFESELFGISLKQVSICINFNCEKYNCLKFEIMSIKNQVVWIRKILENMVDIHLLYTSYSF